MNPLHTKVLPRSMRMVLRAATADLHAAVDRRFAPLFAQGAEGYCRFLQASAAAICPLEFALLRAGVDDILPDWHERSRAESLRLDLDDLAAPAPSIRTAPCFGGENFQLGVLYVLEGSRLGARLLAERAMAHEDSRIRMATRYLRHGEGKRYWQSFLDRLETSTAARHSPQTVIAGAREAFSWFAPDVQGSSILEIADAG